MKLKQTAEKYTACLAIVFCMLLSACKHDNYNISTPNDNIRPAADFLRNNFDYSLFYAAIDYTGLTETLNGPGPFTVLAPTNAAFNALGIQFPGDFKKLNRDSLRQAMAYHIITRDLTTTNMPVNGVDVRYQTLAGPKLYETSANLGLTGTVYNKYYFDGCLASTTNIHLANGTLHALSKVMKQYPGKTVQAWLAARPNYSIFVSGLKKFGLWDELATTGPFTIYAPNNTVLIAAGITQAAVDALDPTKYNGPRLFGAYILYNKFYFSTDVAEFVSINSDISTSFTVRNDDSIFKIETNYLTLSNTAGGWSYKLNLYQFPIVNLDHVCDNGIVHNCDGAFARPANAIKQ